MKEQQKSYEKLASDIDLIYKFVSLYTKYLKIPRSYLVDANVGITEAQIVTLIADNPGITVGDAAALRNTTSPAISQFVSKLVKKDLIYKQKQDGNAKTVHLFPTDKGRLLASAHKAHNNLQAVRFRQGPLSECSAEEMETFFRVLNILSSYYE